MEIVGVNVSSGKMMVWRVIQEGRVAASDNLERVRHPAGVFPVYGLARLRLDPAPSKEEVRKALEAEVLAEQWSEELQEMQIRPDSEHE